MQYYLSLGANIGEREQTIRKAIEQIEQRIGRVPRCSSHYYSAPWGFESKHGFCNVCCLVETALQPEEVLAITQAIERELGRTHKTENGQYADRTIDIDLIRVFDEKGKEVRLHSEKLTIPHPLWKKRDFVSIPLFEILEEGR